jgi:molybdopterin converting factor small subunit
MVERLRSNLEIARQQREQAKMPSTGDVEKIRKKYAEEKVRLAEINLAAMHKYKEKGLPVKDGDIKRLELKLRQAQLSRQLLDSPENLLEIVDSLQRQVDQLHEELIQQDQRLSSIEGEKSYLGPTKKN